MRRWLAVALCAWPMLAYASQARVLDTFDSTQGWKVVTSDQVTGALRSDGKATCLDYDFHGVSGYVGLQKPMALDYPGNYAFAFKLRGEGPKNDFQFKLVDGSGDNVWWATKPKFALPAAWTPMQFKKRHISKAWGPSEDKTLSKSAKLEFTLASGEGGKGAICFDDLTFTVLPPPDDSPLTTTRSRIDDGWMFDLGKVREIGGLIVRKAGMSGEVSLSGDGQHWREVLVTSDGTEKYVALPEEETRYIRVLHGVTPGDADAAPEVEVQPLAFAATPNDFVKSVAARSPRGEYPRGFVGEQSYWTIVGVDGGKEQGLIGEDGAIEVGKGGFSIEPEVFGPGFRATWAEVDATQSLQDGYLPIPSAHWRHRGFKLDVTAFGETHAAQPRLVARYRLTNTSGRTGKYTLALHVRPFQVNPPSQFLNTTGGVSPIHRIDVEPRSARVNGLRTVEIDRDATARSATPFNEMELMEGFEGRPSHVDDDPTGLASGVLYYDAVLEPGASLELAWVSSLAEGVPAPNPLNAGEAASLQVAAARAWHDKLDRVRIRVPKEGQHLVDTLRTALANMSISRVGPRLQPGTRSYSRAWIRDGAMIGEGLLRLGREDIAKDFLAWYAPYQFDSGKVPCCVDDRGADPVPENDSHGELIYLAAEVYRYTRDRALLESLWPHVQGAVKYMDELRASERTEANRAKNPAFYGLMPASISHEGYSAKPMHSYWDDFWALRGYKDAVEIAQWLGHEEDAKRFAASRDQFRDDLYASLKIAMAQKHITFLPGSAELGDFDATSTTIALAPGGEQQHLPQDALLATFERYWREFEQRANGQRAWKDYTPYELRTIGSFVRLGWTERAHAALDFFFNDQQPRAWNQWGEVVSHTPRKPFFLGDLPHAWVASDYVRSALDLFAYERGDQIVLAAGIPEKWMEGEGVAIDGLRTPGGPLAYSLRANTTTVRLDISKGTPPPGGFVFTWKGKETRVTRVPATVELPRQ